MNIYYKYYHFYIQGRIIAVSSSRTVAVTCSRTVAVARKNEQPELSEPVGFDAFCALRELSYDALYALRALGFEAFCALRAL